MTLIVKLQFDFRSLCGWGQLYSNFTPALERLALRQYQRPKRICKCLYMEEQGWRWVGPHLCGGREYGSFQVPGGKSVFQVGENFMFLLRWEKTVPTTLKSMATLKLAYSPTIQLRLKDRTGSIQNRHQVLKPGKMKAIVQQFFSSVGHISYFG